MTPSERDLEMARELTADAHCRYCNWITDSSAYADVMECKGDHADLLETVAAGLARARAEEREAMERIADEKCRCFLERAEKAEAAYEAGFKNDPRIQDMFACVRESEAKLAIAVEALEDARGRVFDQGFKYIAESIDNALAKIKGEEQ